MEGLKGGHDGQPTRTPQSLIDPGKETQLPQVRVSRENKLEIAWGIVTLPALLPATSEDQQFQAWWCVVESANR